MDTSYRARLVDGYLDVLLGQLPAVFVVGPRGSGKTTTLERRAASRVRLDVPAEAAAFEADPDSALRGFDEPVLLDEWQLAPGVLGAVRRAVDADPRPCRFFVTGSARGEVEGGGPWPATGRLVRVPLYPMTLREQRGAARGPLFFDRLASGADFDAARSTPDLRGYVELALRGGFPQPALQLTAEPARRAWLESYIADLFTRDIEQVEQPRTRRRDPGRLRRYFEAYALNSAGAASHKTIYDAAQLSKATAEAYEDLLGALYVVDQLPAWLSNRLKRLAMQPKRYVVDPGLMGASLRLDVNGVMRDGDILGRLLDTLVVAQLRPEAAIADSAPRLHHLRTRGGEREIDVLVEFGGGRIAALEVKATAAPTPADARHLAWLRDELGDRFLRGIVFHTGPRPFELGDRIIAAPISVLWGE